MADIDALGDALGASPSNESDSGDNEGGGNGNGNGDNEGNGEPTGSISDQIRAALDKAESSFKRADAAQRNGDSVEWARLMVQGQKYVEQAVKLSKQLPTDDSSAKPGASESPSSTESDSSSPSS